MADPQWYLAFAWGRTPYALDLPEVVIGRGEGCSLQIDEQAAGEAHARFVVDDEDRVSLEDLGTGTPTRVNGRAISTRTPLKDGDFVQIGSSVLVLRRHSAQVAQVGADAVAPHAASNDGDERVTAARSARNFVVGEGGHAPQHLPTLVMESPLAARPPQRTIEANADELMAAIRRNAEPPAPTMPMGAVTPDSPPRRPEQPTLTVPSLQRPISTPPPVPKPTLIGVGPTSVVTSSAPTMLDTPAAEIARPIDAPETTKPVERVDIVGDEPQREEGDFASLPTQVASVRSQPALPVSRTATHDTTPLPAPLPPPIGASIPDLAPYVARPTAQSHDPPSFGSAATMLLPVTRPTELPLAEQKTMLPSEVPLHEKKTMALPDTPALDSQRSRQFAPPTERVKPIDAKAPMSAPRPADQSHTPQTKGAFGAFSRAFDFFAQMYQLTRREPTLLTPLLYDIVVATALSVTLSVLMFVLPARLASLVMLLGVIGLYFVDYFCNALTASLMYDYANAGALDLEGAKARVQRSLPGIATFAAISGLLDIWTTYARERNDVVAKIILGVIHAIWTTATYAILPAMVLEGIPFKGAFHRAKALMDRDPTGVGAGIVALSLTSYLVGAITFTLAMFFMRLGAHLHPALGVLLFFLLVNGYWAISGWMKIAYSTCFYVWAQRCEAAGRPDSELAPAPLRHALAAG